MAALTLNEWAGLDRARAGLSLQQGELQSNLITLRFNLLQSNLITQQQVES